MSNPSGGWTGAEREWSSELALLEHTPLTVHTQEMRLVKVLPELSADGLVCCEMVHARLEDAMYIAFNALSYMWGTDTPSRPILLNHRTFTVRDNLYDFLRTARHTRPHQWLWIDALSIAQMNNSEKEQQIRLMRDIFISAEQTLIWLGVGDEAIESLMRLTDDELSSRITMIRAQRNADKSRIAANTPKRDIFARDENAFYPIRDRKFHESEYTDGRESHRGDGDLSDIDDSITTYWGGSEIDSVRDDLYYGDEVLLQGTYALEKHPYWSRIWIIQEVLLSSKKTLLHGESQLSWQQYRHLMQLFLPSIIIGKHLDGSIMLSSENPCYNYLHGNDENAEQQILTPDKFDLVSILWVFREPQCTVKHDVVYGILATSMNIRDFPVDYDSGSAELLLNTMLFCLRERWFQASEQMECLPEVLDGPFASNLAARVRCMHFDRSKGLSKLVPLPKKFLAVKLLRGNWKIFPLSYVLRWSRSRRSSHDDPDHRTFLEDFVQCVEKFEQYFMATDIVCFESIWDFNILITRETPSGWRVFGRIGLGRDFDPSYGEIRPSLTCDTYGCSGLAGTSVYGLSYTENGRSGEKIDRNSDSFVYGYGAYRLDQFADEAFLECYMFGTVDARMQLRRQSQSREVHSQNLAQIYFTDIRAAVILFMLPNNVVLRDMAISILLEADGLEPLGDVRCFGIPYEYGSGSNADTTDTPYDYSDWIEATAATQSGRTESHDTNKRRDGEHSFVTTGVGTSEFSQINTLQSIENA